MKEGLRKVLAPISPRVFGSYLDISLSIFVWVAEYFSTLVICTPTRTCEELVKGRTAPWMPLCGESWPPGSSSFAHWNHFFIGKLSMNSSSDTVGTQDGQPKKVSGSFGTCFRCAGFDHSASYYSYHAWIVTICAELLINSFPTKTNQLRFALIDKDG